MRSAFLASFLRDVERLRDAQVRARVRRAVEAVEGAESLEELAQFKWLTAIPASAASAPETGAWGLPSPVIL